MSWMDSRLEALRLDEEEKKRVQQETHQLEQQPPSAWLNLIAAIEANLAEWNCKNERTQLQLNQSAGQISLHHAGQLGSILELHLDPRALVVKYSAPTRQSNHWMRHSGELQINSEGLFAGSPGSEVPKPLTAAETSQFLLKPVLFG